MKLKKLIGDRAFYSHVLAVAVPVMIQNGITNFVNMLDNLMVGRLGTEQLSGVSIVNKYIFVFNLLVFGAVSAAGIFTAQYHGKGDREGVRNTFRLKFLISVTAAAIFVAAFFFLRAPLISLFLHEGTEESIAATLTAGTDYLSVIVIGLIPYALAQVFASTMRETGENLMPMIGSVVAIATNFVLNLLLIFGLLGCPALGVVGAAIATVTSRFVELFILVIYAYTHKQKFPYLEGALRSFRVPARLAKQVAVKGLPLMLNEFFFALSLTVRSQCFSERGLYVVAAETICTTVFDVFSVIFMSFGVAISIIVGNLLGAGRLEEAEDTDRKMIAFSAAVATGLGLLLAAVSPIYPLFYETEDSVRALATYMIIVNAVAMPFDAFSNASYFTLRSGGSVMITILFDSFYMWAVIMPITAALAYFTNVGIHLLYLAALTAQMCKAIFGYILVRKKENWLRCLVASEQE